MRLIHCADLHLGRRRLDGRLPESDFAAAFERIVARAIEWKAQVMLLAGDLFDAPQIPPPVLRQAVAALAPLKKARLRVLAIEGNHDRPQGSVTPSWVRYLSEDGLLTLLHTPFTATGPCLAPYDSGTGQGGVLEHEGIRFVGAGYLGAGTDRKVRALVDALPESGLPTVLLLHAGPEYLVGESGGFERETLERLRSKITYLALGHLHRSLAVGGEPGRHWAINPGSPENCRLDEESLPQPRGWAEVELDPHALPGLRLVRAEIAACPRRPVKRLDLDVSPYGNKLKEGAEAIANAAGKALAALAPSPDTAIRLFLHGQLNLGRIAVDPAALGASLAERARVAAVEVNLDGLRFFSGRLTSAENLDLKTKSEIERMALEEALRERPLAGLEAHLEESVALCGQLRELVARDAPPETVLELLAASPLPAELAAAQPRGTKPSPPCQPGMQ